MSKTATDPYLVSRTVASLALDFSWRRMQGFIMRGMPVKQQGAQGVPWIFDLESVVVWAARRGLLRKAFSLPCSKCSKWHRVRLRPKVRLEKIDRERMVCRACRELDDEL